MKKGCYDPTVGVTNILEGEIQGRASSHYIIVGLTLHSQGIPRKLLLEQETRSVMGSNPHCLQMLDFVRQGQPLNTSVHTSSSTPTIIQHPNASHLELSLFRGSINNPKTTPSSQGYRLAKGASLLQEVSIGT
jgi:hypothetical protein